MPLGVVTSVNVTVGVASHASVAVAAGKVGVAGHSIGETTVGHVRTGGVLSVTVIVRLHVAELPQSSVAVNIRVTLYSCKHIPLGVKISTEVIVGVPSQASVAVAGGKSGSAGHSIGVTTVGHVKTGGVLSVTKIVRLHVEELPQSSVAVHVRVTLYSWGQIPLGVVTSANVIAGVASHASVAVAAGNVGVAGHSIGDTTVGHVITGAVLSVTAIVLLHVAELPQSSVAVHVLVTLYSWGQIPLGVVTSEKVIVGEASQSSVAVAAGNVGVAGHSIGVTTVGHVITGAVSSAAVNVCIQVSISTPSLTKYVRTTVIESPRQPVPVTTSLDV